MSEKEVIASLANPCPWCGQHPARRGKYKLAGAEGPMYECPNMKDDQVVFIAADAQRRFLADE